MSLTIEQINQIYWNCLTLLKAKQNLYIDYSELNALIRQIEFDINYNEDIYIDFIEDGLLKLMKIWIQKFNTLESFQLSHENAYNQLKFKIQSLKSNTQVVNTADHTLSQIQTIMRAFKQNASPVEYYNIKFRRNIKKQISQKLQQLKKIQGQSQNVIAPQKIQTIQNQLRSDVSAMYYQQSNIDNKLINSTIETQTKLTKIIYNLDSSVLTIPSSRKLNISNNLNIKQAHEIIKKQSKLSDRRMKAYSDLIVEGIRQNLDFWVTFLDKIQHLAKMVSKIKIGLARVNQNFETASAQIYKLLDDVPEPVAKLFRVNVLCKILQSFKTIGHIAQCIDSFEDKVLKRKNFTIKMLNQCKEYIKRINQENSQRYEHFHHFVLVDNKLFQDQAKSQKIVTKLLLQSFKQFLQECQKLTKETRKDVYFGSKFQILQSQQLNHQICSLQKYYINSKKQLQTIQKVSRKQMGQKNESRQKINEIQQFLNNIYVFNASQVSDSQKFHSCAFGSKLLLHGKLFILPQGLFFQSFFNKKNLFFGKTKIFIPKSQIVQIDTKKTLLVFPDAVVVKTKSGLAIFHALGRRKQISNEIKNAYLGNDESQQITQTVEKFKQFDESKRPDQNAVKNISQPFQNALGETILKGSKLNSVFKRYFGEDSFQWKNKTYKTFKQYNFQLIQAKNPQSTQLTPNPPVYFCHKTQDCPQNHYPQLSTRQHKYGKQLPKIPFLSKGGLGQCEQKQKYYWLGPNLLVIEVLSTVKGFSLTEGMEIFIKYVLKQQANGVKINISSKIKFAKQSSSNNLVRGPTINNMKQSFSKVLDTIQKSQKTRQVSKKQQNSETIELRSENQNLLETPSGDSSINIKLSKRNFQLVAIGVIILYILTIVLVKNL